MLRNADGGGGCQLFRKRRYEGARFNVISVTRGWVGGSNFQEKLTGYFATVNSTQLFIVHFHLRYVKCIIDHISNKSHTLKVLENAIR